MILTRVKHGLRSLEAATASQLAAELSLGRRDVAIALEFWINRGDVRACEESVGPACGTSCTKCPIGQLPNKRRASADAHTKTAAHQPVGPGLTGGASPVVYEWVSR
ncbi:MAG: hypothetical protein GVY23_06845 [Spirochaetes bacterium]|jgi:hypothetical protein|nr:hypothetical protein [Spirochaetota bacterium]